MKESRKILFVCSRDRLRSPTADAICQGVEGIEAISAGTNNDAEQPLTGDLIEWADVVFLIERQHRDRVSTKFRDQHKGKHMLVLGIPDDYNCMQPELVDLLRSRLRRWIGEFISRLYAENPIGHLKLDELTEKYSLEFYKPS